MASNTAFCIPRERPSRDSNLGWSEGGPASSCLRRMAPQLSLDFTPRSDCNTFMRLATDVDRRVSRDSVYGGFGARWCTPVCPEESALAVVSVFVRGGGGLGQTVTHAHALSHAS